MFDIERARRGRQLVTATIGVTDSAFLNSHEKRWGVLISAHPTNRFTIQFQGAAVLDQGITVYPGTLPLLLTHADFG